jgi:hypothetical protein
MVDFRSHIFSVKSMIKQFLKLSTTCQGHKIQNGGLKLKWRKKDISLLNNRLNQEKLNSFWKQIFEYCFKEYIQPFKIWRGNSRWRQNPKRL